MEIISYKIHSEILLKQHKSPTDPNTLSRDITPTKIDQRGPKVELDLYHVDTYSSKNFQGIILYNDMKVFSSC